MRITLKISFLLFFLTSYLAHSQVGDGPESHFLKPQKMWGLNFKYINLNQNVSLNGDYIDPRLDLEVNSFPITLFSDAATISETFISS